MAILPAPATHPSGSQRSGIDVVVVAGRLTNARWVGSPNCDQRPAGIEPDLIVYLQAPVEVLMQRVRRRDRAIEKTLSADYLERLSEAYARFFYFYEASPVLIVNAAEINPVESAADYAALLLEICRPRHGRRYFNPSPLDIH